MTRPALESRRCNPLRPERPAPSHRLRRRLLRRPHRRRRPGGRGADRRRRAVVPDLRDAWPSAPWRWRSWRGGSIPTHGYEPLLDELLRPVLARCLGARHPHRQQLRRRQSARRGAAHRRPRRRARPGAAADRGGRGRRPRLGRAATAAARGARRRAPTSTPCCRRWSAPTPTSAPSRSPTRCSPARRSSSPAASPTRRSPSARRSPTLGWRRDDWDRLARATMAGHLLECGAQVSGGYYADPGYKDIPDLAHVGYPIAEIDADGHCTITKPAGTGGRIDAHTVTEQLLYEVHDPAAYLTPDVVADLSEARVVELGPDRVRARRRARPSAAGDAQGQRLQRAGLAGRRRDLLRRRARRGARPARGRGAARSACSRSAGCAST